ncbi:hypothetical protein [Halococcus salsus]|uniref:hypothetical protein n=1 Tax=Halococcus salsus TaxID=2162894 RepID=UPI00135C2EFA|nr:hypothetical protein [Halococcus salsus]
MTEDPTQSILSHEERAVAAALAAGTDPVAIADERDASIETVEAAVERIREKTERAFATLAESPFTADLATDLDPEDRAALREAFSE